jgi:hypothetical protein
MFVASKGNLNYLALHTATNIIVLVKIVIKVFIKKEFPQGRYKEAGLP